MIVGLCGLVCFVFVLLCTWLFNNCLFLLSCLIKFDCFLVCFSGRVCGCLFGFVCWVCGYLWFLLLAGVYFRLRLLVRLLYVFLLGFGCFSFEFVLAVDCVCYLGVMV